MICFVDLTEGAARHTETTRKFASYGGCMYELYSVCTTMQRRVSPQRIEVCEMTIATERGAQIVMEYITSVIVSSHTRLHQQASLKS